MIQAVLSYQFILNQKETGEIEPEFRPIVLNFNDKEFTKEDYSKLITENDIFAIFYQHTTGIQGAGGTQSNFYTGRLKETPYQVMSFFRQEPDGTQFLAISVFELDDELEIFEDLVQSMAEKLGTLFEEYLRAKNSRQLNLLTKKTEEIEDQLKFTIFQVDRLSQLDKLQKVALIFNSEERLKILELLRECPISKRELKRELEKIKPNPNVDILIEPFLELNLIRRDWIAGDEKKRRGAMDDKTGEFLFLTKDIVIARYPNESLLEQLQENKQELYEKFNAKTIEYFSEYDPTNQPIEEVKKIAHILLNPDIFDFFTLMKNNYYPVDKIPKILSNWADTETILKELTDLKILTKISDKGDREWLLLLSDIKPLIIFPEYILPKIKKALDVEVINQEIARKALDLLEVTFQEKVEF